MAKTPEGEVQAYGAEQLKKHCCLVRKISYEGRRGAADYIAFIPGGRVVFIEFKKSAELAAAGHQNREHQRMMRRGADVRVIGSRQQVDALIQELFPS